MKDGPIYRRYEVVSKDGLPIDIDTPLFVLNLDTDPYAQVALQAYRAACYATHPELSMDIGRTFGVPFPKVLSDHIPEDRRHRVLELRLDFYRARDGQQDGDQASIQRSVSQEIPEGSDG